MQKLAANLKLEKLKILTGKHLLHTVQGHCSTRRNCAHGLSYGSIKASIHMNIIHTWKHSNWGRRTISLHLQKSPVIPDQSVFAINEYAIVWPLINRLETLRKLAGATLGCSGPQLIGVQSCVAPKPQYAYYQYSSKKKQKVHTLKHWKCPAVPFDIYKYLWIFIFFYFSHLWSGAL